ncbi:hypothetical protein OBBRIDRAFT_836993 [Obba rivulosa]|uniref:Uncharacterized protein n=1 Tax=Obba rivulosa TaxID=1052685 RepID=A0A8E2DI89_9APHY|nr:hypothetical protein OBBRIDRAFT_836993 [Obba rivulosa]
MPIHNFVGDKPVDQFPPEATQKIDEMQLTKEEIHRDPRVQPGANRRAGVATRDPEAFDTTGDGGRGGWGDPKPIRDPVI